MQIDEQPVAMASVKNHFFITLAFNQVKDKKI